MNKDNNVYVVTETVAYQDFETHYETKVLKVFKNFDDASKFCTQMQVDAIKNPKGYGPYSADEVNGYVYQVDGFEVE